MRVSIAAGASTDHTGRNLTTMVVDGHLLLVDLSKVAGHLWDEPTVASIIWGPVTVNGARREGGTVFLKNGTQRKFADPALLTPYLGAFKLRKTELLGEKA